MPGTYYRRALLAVLGAALLMHLDGLAWPPYKTGLFCTPASAAVLDSRAIQSETMSNGLRLIVAPEPETEVVAIQVIVKAGSADDPPGQTGMAHLLEHLLWAGSGPEENSPRARIERVGGTVEAGTLRDYTRFFATVPSKDMALALEALGEIVLKPTFSEAVMTREREVILDESAGRAENPHAVLNDLAFAGLYDRSHPYGNPIEGSPEDLSSIDTSRLALFYRSWYVPNNMAVVIVGGIEFDAAREAVKRLFGELAPAPAPSRASPTPPRPSNGGERIAPTAGRSAYVMAAFVGPEVGEHYQICASDLLATVLANGHLGRLELELREKQEIASEVGIAFLTQRERALFGVWAVCEPDRIAEVKQAIKKELSRLAVEPVSASELATAKRLLAAGYAFANETPADRATTLGFYEAIDSYRTASSYLSWVTHTESARLAEVARWYAGEPVWVILQPEQGR